MMVGGASIVAEQAETGQQDKQAKTDSVPAVDVAQPTQEALLDMNAEPGVAVAVVEVSNQQETAAVTTVQTQSLQMGEHEPPVLEGTDAVEPVIAQSQPIMAQSQPIVAQQEPIVAQQVPIVTQQEPIITQQEPIVTQQESIVTQQQAAVASSQPVADQPPMSDSLQQSPENVQAAVPAYIPVAAPSTSDLSFNNTATASTTANIATAPAPIGKPSLSNEYTKGNNLIVNYVPKSFTDVQLYELFMPFGEIESARAIQDRHTGQCAGYGFIKFQSADAAANAVKHYEIVVPDHRQLKVHFARPSSTHKQCNIYVSGLPIHYTEDDTKALFAPYGPVVEVKVLLGKDGESRGCGFVRLCNIANTHAAISALNESVPPGGSSRINVVLAAGTKRETANNPAFNIAQVPFPPQLLPYGRTPPPPPMQFYGGFPTPSPYGYPQAVPPAVGMQNFGGYQPLRHQPVRNDTGPYAPPITPLKEHFTGFCLFIFNLPMEYDENSLRVMFGQFGQVTSAKLMRDQATGRSKGYGFVNMGAENQAQMAIQALNGYPLNGKALKVQFKTPGPTPKPPTPTITPSASAPQPQNFYQAPAKSPAPPPPPAQSFSAAAPPLQTPNYYAAATKSAVPPPQAPNYYASKPPQVPNIYAPGSQASTSYYAGTSGSSAGTPPLQAPSYYITPPGSSAPPQAPSFY